MKSKTKLARLCSILLTLVMVVGMLPTTALAESGSATEPSVSAYATKEQMMGATFAPDADGKARNIGKIELGKNDQGTTLEWYLLGRDNGVTGDNTAIFVTNRMMVGYFNADGANGSYTYEAGTGYGEEAGSIEVFANHYGRSGLRQTLQDVLSDRDYFTEAEQNILNPITVTTHDEKNNVDYTTTDKLYLVDGEGDLGDAKLFVGTNNSKVLHYTSYWDYNYNWNKPPYDFFLRKGSGKSTSVRVYYLSSYYAPAYQTASVDYNQHRVLPASNLNLSSVLFASAAQASSGTIPAGRAMTLRLDGTDKGIGTAFYYPEIGAIKATKGSTSKTVSLIVQGNDGTSDWCYSKNVDTTVAVTASDIKTALDLAEDVELSKCKIWVEITDADKMIYAVSAIRSTVSDVSTVEITDIDAPQSETALDTAASCVTTGIINTTPTVTWTPDHSQACYSTIYTASVTLTADVGYRFPDSLDSVTVNGNLATSAEKNADGTLTVTYTFPETSAANIISTVEITDIDVPASNVVLDSSAFCTATGIKNTTLSVSWTPNPPRDSKANYYQTYTATVNLIADTGCTFSDTVTATVNGKPATSVQKGNYNATNDGKKLTVTYEFPKTEKHNIEITFNANVRDGDVATNPSISSGYEVVFCFFCEDTNGDGDFINDRTLVVDKVLLDAFLEEEEMTFEEFQSAIGATIKTKFTGGCTYSVYAAITHSDGAYFDSDEDDKVTNAIIKVNNEDITDNCLAYDEAIAIMPGTCVFTASSAATYTVTFDANGGSVTPASAVTDTDGKLTSLPTPTRRGYSFNGWYTEASGGTKVDTDYAFNTDTTIYAHWTSTGGGGGGGTTRYTVSFETNGGSKVSSKTVTRNTAVSEPTAPTKDGYTFDGWYSDKALKIAYDFSAKVTKSFTLYAKWTEKATEPDKPTEPTVPEWKNPFTDVKKSDWFYTNVEYAVNNKLMNGTTATTFAPSENLTRAMLIAILYRAESEPAVNKSIPFSDVAVNAYYANAVIWAQQNGIVNGVTENAFAPDNNITREQIAAIMFRFAKYKGYDVSVGESTNILSYTDARDVSEYAVSAMQYAVGSGLMKGKTESTINPLDNATRAEIAAILQRFIEANK